MFLSIIIGFLSAFTSPFVYRLFKRNAGVILASVPFGIFLYFCSFFESISNGKEVIISYPWIPNLGIDIVFLLDGLSLFFSLLITGFGTLIILYAASYLKADKQLGRFYLYLLMFMTAMLGLVISGNIISLFVFWELTSLSSYFLIGFNHESSKSRQSALLAMLITAGGGLAMLAGFLLLGISAETYSLPDILNQHDVLVNSPYYIPIVLLVLTGAYTKSAQFPFHFWLPEAMAAPTPVSAYLHSATMVKAGVYIVARLNPALGNTPLWETLLIATGCITMVVGAVMAIRFTDLKKVLAYTTISALGMLFLMLGIGTPYSIQAAIIFILAHALYKGTLFLMTGNLDHQTGSRDIKELSGLRKVMPFTALAAILACMSMSGVIPFIGFIGKELIYEAALNATLYNIILLVSIVFSSIIFTAVAIDIAYGIFFGKLKTPGSEVKEAKPLMLIGPLVIASFGLFFGLFPQLLTQPLLNISVAKVLKDVEVITLSLWHGFNFILLLSLITLVLGLILYYFRITVRKGVEKMSILEKIGPAILFQKGLKGLLTSAFWITRITQNGYLRYYIASIMWVFIGLGVYVIVNRNLTLNLQTYFEGLLNFTTYELIICVFIVMGVIKIFYSRSRITALASMGVVGYGIALIFIFFSAPDAAMTQFLIETLTVVLFVLVLHRLPPFETFFSVARRSVYLLLSICFGVMMTYILLLVLGHPMESELKAFFGQNSVALGQGRNIVNVILVDFRAMDTLGETVVLGIAAIGIFTLLKLKLGQEDNI